MADWSFHSTWFSSLRRCLSKFCKIIWFFYIFHFDEINQSLWFEAVLSNAERHKIEFSRNVDDIKFIYVNVFCCWYFAGFWHLEFHSFHQLNVRGGAYTFCMYNVITVHEHSTAQHRIVRNQFIRLRTLEAFFHSTFMCYTHTHTNTHDGLLSCYC